VIRGAVTDLNLQASEQALPKELSGELRELLVLSTHRIEKARDVGFKFLNRLLTSFPSLMCDPPLVLAILEALTLLSRAVEDEFTDEVHNFVITLAWFSGSFTAQFNPIYEFHSERADITLHLTDNYKVRNDILGQLQRSSQNWFELALGRAPVELQATLQVRIYAMPLPALITHA
jgi:phosphatidylinositol 4-kinase